jgi:hypothetical protein
VRHSGASTCIIETAIKDEVVLLSVTDNGVGFSPDAQERYGLRNTIRASIAAIGGSTSLVHLDGDGAMVQITVPVGIPFELQLPAKPAIDILLQPLSIRLFLLGGAAFGLLMLPWIAHPFGYQAQEVSAAYLAFIAANIFLALVWHLRWRMLAAFAVVAATFTLYATTQQAIGGCEVASSIQWIINSVGSCLGLLLFASFGKPWNWLILPGLTALGLWLFFTLPDQCQDVLIMPLIATSTYLTAAMYLVWVLLTASDRQRLRAIELWTAATAKRAEVAKLLETNAQWSRVSAGTRSLLLALAEGDVDPNESSVRQRAAREEAQLRANLDMRGSGTSEIWKDLLRVSDRLASEGFPVEVQAIELPNHDRHLPAVALAILDEVVRASGSNVVSIRLIVDQGTPEVVCTCGQAIANEVWKRFFGGSQDQTMPTQKVLEHDTTVSFERMEEGMACFIIRQESDSHHRKPEQ